jgi:glycosyltransferase involved in cell wall biosynthesis
LPRSEEDRVPGRIRLLVVIPDFTGGGAERAFSGLLRLLPREGFEVHLCLWRDARNYYIPPDIPVHILNKHRPWHFLRVLRGTQRIIERLQPDVVLSTLYFTNLVTGEAILRSHWRGGWVCRLENAPERQIRGPLRLWAGRVLRRADCVVGNSRGVSAAAVSHLGLDRSRVRTIYNPVDFDRITSLAQEALPFERFPETFVVVHAGRFSRQKNQRLLLGAFAELPPPAELWMLGQGRLRSNLAGEAARLGIARRVRWMGFQGNPFRFFRAADAFVLSSDWEGMPNSLVEAMACGTPVISTRCDYGPEEIVETGSTGLLVERGDRSGLRDALGSLRDSPDLRRKLGDAGKESVMGTFDPSGSVENYAALFRKLAAGRSVRPGDRPVRDPGGGEVS